MQTAQGRMSFERLAAAAHISPDNPDFAAQVDGFIDRLTSLSAYARKLLVNIVELAYHGRGQQRKKDVAYLPELYESTGLGVEAMYPLLEELREARFIEVEDRYPFEDVKIAAEASGLNLLENIARCCEQQKISVHVVLVDGRFELMQ